MFDTAVLGMATVAFWCQCHLAKVCVDLYFEPLIHGSHTSPQKSGTTVSNIYYSLFWAPSMKTNPAGEEIRGTDSTCPCSAEWAFKNHLRINGHVPLAAHIFTFETDSGSFDPMHMKWFLDNEIWSSVLLSPLSSHSFRSSGTTHLLLLGMDPFIVMAQGHWKLTAFLEYWCLCEEIIPTFIGFYLQSQVSLLSTMGLFKKQLVSSM